MQWPRLLSRERYKPSPSDDADIRTPYERDQSRLLFSNAFRRLHNKTQVFPVPDNDHVHSRLTHSLEVADVGRHLGKLVGAQVVARHGLQEHGIAASDLAEVVAAACLAHDIGNPPFGHAGEDAIGQFFASGRGSEWIAGLEASQRSDLQHFEGNAQGFRIVARTAMSRDRGGMRLTAAVLGAFSKYPQGSDQQGDRSRVGGKKFGYFQAEKDLFAQVADACGLLPDSERPATWCRHPLAFLMEAADDICYHVLDLEDGVMLRLIDQTDMARVLAPLLGKSEAETKSIPISVLRAWVITGLVRESVELFLDNEEAILAGTFQQALTDAIPSAAAMQEIYALNMARCYRSQIALDLEQTGYNVIGGLLQNLCESVFAGRNERLHRVLPEPLPEGAGPYEKILHLTDYVSGMTDRFALRRYQGWTGISLRSV